MTTKKIEDLSEDVALDGDEWLLVTDGENTSKKLSTGKIHSKISNEVTTLSGALQQQIDTKTTSLYVDSAVTTISGYLQPQISEKTTSLYVDSLVATASGYLQEQLSYKADTSCVDSDITTLSGYLQPQIDARATSSYVNASLSSKATMVSGSTINYTVGSGSQFETLKECFNYIGGAVYTAGTAITVTLAVQDHIIDSPIVNRSFYQEITLECGNQEIHVTDEASSFIFDLRGSGHIIFRYAKFVNSALAENPYLCLINATCCTIGFWHCTFTSFECIMEAGGSVVWIQVCTITSPPSGISWAAFFIYSYSCMSIYNTTVDNVAQTGYSYFIWMSDNSFLDVDTMSVKNFDVGFYARSYSNLVVKSVSFINTTLQYDPPKGAEGNKHATILDYNSAIRRITSNGLNLFDTGYIPTVPLSPVNKGYVDLGLATVSGVHGVSGAVVGTTDSQVITNKTFSNCKEVLYNTTSSGNIALDLTRGPVQRYILDGDRQLTMPEGPGLYGTSFTLILECNSYTPIWNSSPALTWLTVDGLAPTLASGVDLVSVLTFIWDGVDNRWLGLLNGKEVI